jgi:hypothetical protein
VNILLTRRADVHLRQLALSFPLSLFFSFKGTGEYLEDLVFWIDAPQLYRLSITFWGDHIGFNNPELNQFIRRTPTFGAYDEARLIFYSREAQVRLRPFQPGRSDQRMIEVKILCRLYDDWELSYLAQICSLSLHLFLTMENLFIHENLYSSPNWKDGIEDTEWLDLLLPFTAVKHLHLSKQLSLRIAPALQELTGGRTTEVLPALRDVLLEGFQPSDPVQEGIAQFIFARQLTNHPVAISAWNGDLVFVVAPLPSR